MTYYETEQKKLKIVRTISYREHDCPSCQHPILDIVAAKIGKIIALPVYHCSNCDKYIMDEWQTTAVTREMDGK